MNTHLLRFPNHEHADLVLEQGATNVGRDPDHDRGLAILPRDQPALVQIAIDRRGVWMSVADATWGVHVNGRPVRHLACLRAGDTLHVEGMEMQLLRESAPAAPSQPAAAPATPAPVLRGVAGPLYGQALEAETAAQRITLQSGDALPAFRLNTNGTGIDVSSTEANAFRVNGFPVSAATLQLGDQLTLADGQRFVLEGPGNVPKPVAAPSPRAAARDAADALGQEVRRWSVPWVLVSAVVIALALLAVFWFGA